MFFNCGKYLYVYLFYVFFWSPQISSICSKSPQVNLYWEVVIKNGWPIILTPKTQGKAKQSKNRKSKYLGISQWLLISIVQIHLWYNGPSIFFECFSVIVYMAMPYRNTKRILWKDTYSSAGNILLINTSLKGHGVNSTNIPRASLL